MNYVLIGMPGSGKTTIGRLLAEQLNFDFVDSDHYLETYFAETIPQMFAKGEPYFRERESLAIKQISQLDQTVIATGGGVILFEENISNLKTNGLIIFLDRSPDEIIKDLAAHERPLLAKDKNRLYNLYDQRINLYRKYADLTISNQQDPKSVLNLILDKIPD